MKKMLLLLSVFALLISSCSKSDDDTPDSDPQKKAIELSEKAAKLVKADNEFGLELFKKVRSANDTENIMISPLSVSLALAMAYNGADGDTKTEMESMLNLNDLSVEEINNSYQTLVNALKSVDDKVALEIANAIFYDEAFPVKDDFFSTNKNYYDAEVDDLDFASSEAVKIINNWVADKTNDKIKEIISQLSPENKLVLLNAIYFNGIWTTEFDEDATSEQAFTKANGISENVAMMSKTDSLDYMKNSLFSAIKIPYGTGQYNMIVMLPAESTSSTELIDKMSSDNWNGWQDDFSPINEVVITMPRFKFGYEIEMNDILKEMGMEKAFSATNADFSGISDFNLYISYVKHKSYIDVNEKGTEAAAVTAIGFDNTCASSEEDKTYFTVNRPFVFAITEKDTNAILFIGNVQNPEYEE